MMSMWCGVVQLLLSLLLWINRWRAFQLLNDAGDYRLNTTVGNGSAVAAAGLLQPSSLTENSKQINKEEEDEESWEQGRCSLVEGVDFKGGDLLPDSLHFNTSTAAACCAACQAKAGCEVWSWGHNDHSRLAERCYLKQLAKHPEESADIHMSKSEHKRNSSLLAW